MTIIKIPDIPHGELGSRMITPNCPTAALLMLSKFDLNLANDLRMYWVNGIHDRRRCFSTLLSLPNIEPSRSKSLCQPSLRFKPVEDGTGNHYSSGRSVVGVISVAGITVIHPTSC